MSIIKGTLGTERSDLYSIHNISQNSLFSHPKDIVISILRDFFAEDSTYHYVSDQWGYCKIVDLTDLPADAGVNDDETTRIFIGEGYRTNARFYPAAIVKNGSAKYTPIAFNRNKETIRYDATRVIDGYGNEAVFTTPSHFVLAGAWEGQLTIDVTAKSIIERDDIARLVMLFCTDIRHKEMEDAGVYIKGVSAGAPSESDDGNEKLFKQSITLEIRTEWRREIPISSTIDAINICVDFGRLDTGSEQIAPNIRIVNILQLIDLIDGL